MHIFGVACVGVRGVGVLLFYVCRVEYSLPTHCMDTIFYSFVQSSCMKTVSVGLQCQLWSIVVHVFPAVRHWTTPGRMANRRNIDISVSFVITLWKKTQMITRNLGFQPGGLYICRSLIASLIFALYDHPMSLLLLISSDSNLFFSRSESFNQFLCCIILYDAVSYYIISFDIIPYHIRKYISISLCPSQVFVRLTYLGHFSVSMVWRFHQKTTKEADVCLRCSQVRHEQREVSNQH